MRALRTILMFACQACLAVSPLAAADDQVDYLGQVKPLLKGRCYACHGALKQEAGLRLDTGALVLKGSDSGPVIAPGDKAAKSVLLQRLSTREISERMPPEHEGEAFKPEEIELLRRWIAAGAPAPPDETPEPDPEEHWSFLPVVRREPPPARNADWVRNPIDAWIAAAHQRQGLVPQPEAPRIVLLRRLSIDLIGLPPTAEEVAEFEADQSPDWYEKAVDRLLKDPRHGERWARHWMDVWRYADWSGFNTQLRYSHRHLWRWRDWIVESLNQDVGYDEMVRLMLAADELAPGDPDRLRATGYLARNYYIFNRNRWMEDVVTHVSKGLLGLTVNCAKCHDHKFDPISQRDYYKLQAFFEPYHVRIDMVPGEVDLIKDGVSRAFDGVPDAPTYLLVRGDDARPDTSEVIPPGVPEFLEFDRLDIRPVDLPRPAWEPGLQPWVVENHLSEAKKKLEQAESSLRQAEQAVRSRRGPGSSASDADQPASVSIVDTFERFDSQRWQSTQGGWGVRAGQQGLFTEEQSLDSTLTLRARPPQDFEALMRFRILGGRRWRSVGLVFDDVPKSSAGGMADSGVMIYLTGESSNPRLQAAVRKDGKWTYPTTARKAIPVELDREYTLEVRARGEVINVALNGEHVLAWAIPSARLEGDMRLIASDAQAVIQEFRLAQLDSETLLVQPDGARTLAPGQALELALAEVDVARAEVHSLTRRREFLAAERDSALPRVSEKRRDAIVAGRQAALEQARRDRIVAEQALIRAAGDMRADAEKKLSAANDAWKLAKAAAESAVQPDDQLAPLAGAQWAATRFAHTGKDDPAVPFPSTSTGRRTALALWLTDRRNPLTARVAVNHIWNRHFGAPLAPVTFDFGRSSAPPAHPELLDWLASEFMDQGWSMKHLHRMIVLSSTYRMSSSLAGAGANADNDPDNRYWWRRSPLRVESQVVRDSLLALAGTLDPTIGGPSIPADLQDDSRRRSLYFFHTSRRHQFLAAFDDADVDECYSRDQSIVPQQALALTNSRLALDAARQISARLSPEAPADTEFVRKAFVSLLGIHPSEAELDSCLRAMDRWKNLPDGSSPEARAKLVEILLNHNDFVTLR